MKAVAPDNCTGVTPLRVLLALILCAGLPLLGFATAPTWWAQHGVIVTNAAADDYAPANHGQLKNIAKAAVTEMDAKLPGGAGDELHNLMNAWSAPSPETNDFASLNIGQLKNVAKPFYDRLIAAGLANAYPWAGRTAPADDFAAANIGQVKSVFSFDLPTLDADGNGLPDAWEQQYFGTSGVDPAADADGDGLTNLQEYRNGSDPTDYYNGDLPTLAIYSGGDQSTIPGNFLALPVSVRVSATGSYNAPLTFTVTQGPALLAADNSGSSTPATTINIRSTSVVEDENGNQTYMANVYVYLPTTATAVSTIQASATTASQTVSVSTTAAPLNAATLSPPTNFLATALSGTTVALSWTASNTAVPTTLQMSVDAGSHWYTVGVVGPGIESAMVTNLVSDMTVTFRAFTGGIYPAGGGNTLPAPSLSGPPAPIPPSPTTTPSTVTPLSYPTIKGETVGYGHYKNGRAGFLFSTTHNYYLTETKVTSTEHQDDNGSWSFSGSTTTTSTFDPLTGQPTTQPSVTVGGGGYDVELYGGTLTTVSDSLKRLIGTGYPGDRARSTFTDTLSNIYTTDMLVQNVEARVPAFRNQFTVGGNWAYIYLDPSGSAYDVYKLQYKWQANAAQTPLVIWDEVLTPYDTDGNWNPGANGENIKHNVKRWLPNGSDSPVYIVDPTQQNNKHNGYYEVLLVRIEPDDPGQTDIKGAMVPSIKTDETQQKHFVTPKTLGDTVTFRTTLGDSSNDFDLLYEWHVPSGVTVSGGTVVVPRDTANKYTIELRIKGTSTVVDTLNVWIVTADISPDPSHTAVQPTPTPNFTGATLRAENYFVHSITPTQIFNDPDRPDLAGEIHDAPGKSACKNLNSGVQRRWDASRQVSTSYVKTNFSLTLYSCADQHGVIFPEGADANIVGNDDGETNDERKFDPYNPAALGYLTDEDAPQRVVDNFAGTVGDSVEFNLSFREFTRVKLGNIWYRISPFYRWHVKFAFKKIGISGDAIWTKDSSSTMVNDGY